MISGSGIEQSVFESSSRSVLALLQKRTEFDLWMMTQTIGNDWKILHTANRSYAVHEGMVLRWSDSFCSRMVDGQGPRVAAQSDTIPCYAAAPIAQQVPIGAYMGVPVSYSDGRLFGTLCAIDPEPQPLSVEHELSLVEVCGELLGSILDTEQRSRELARLLTSCQKEAATDRLTGVFNRTGWETAISVEERRSTRYKKPLSVVVVDLDDLKSINDNQGHRVGDEVLKTAAQVLRGALRESDIVARLGGDEFGVLLIDCNEKGAHSVVEKMKMAFSTHGINASIGKSTFNEKFGLDAAIDQADREMYRAKNNRKQH